MLNWTTPDDWLHEHIDTLDEAGLRNLIDALRDFLEDDIIVPALGDKMEADGYFEGREDEYDGYQMTFEQAVEVFTKTHLPYVIAEFGDDDAIAKREAWNNWTDAICKNGVITEWQYDNWDNPF
jgi:hypothetical protein